MALLLFFAAFALAAMSHAVGQPGFLSIDCGLEGSGYNDTDTGIVYVSDGAYIDAGENHRVPAEEESGRRRAQAVTLRSFPTGVRNCYSLPTAAGSKYLVRVVSSYGNYDGTSSASTLQFDLHLGTNYWDTVRADGDEVYEVVFVAWASWAPVCLVNTGQGTPFVSSVELRPLGNLYPAVTANRSMRMSIRRTMGPTTSHVTRFPTDQYDRYWWEMRSNPMWANLSTTSGIKEESTYKAPSAILQKAITTARNGTMLNITWEDRMLREFRVYLHFADFQNKEVRQFNICVNSHKPYTYTPGFMAAGSVSSSAWYSSNNGEVNITLTATAKSVLPPMLNAFEIYTRINHGTPTTFSNDFDAIMAIKLEYGVRKNWMGDPCSPTQFAWDGVKCRNTSDNILRIISIDLSNSNLHGMISNNFTLLTSLEYLNLAGNELSGPIPDSLCKTNAGSLFFSYDSGRDMCTNTISASRNRAAILAISVTAPFLVVVALLVAYLIWRAKRKPIIFRYNHPGDLELKNPPGVPEPKDPPAVLEANNPPRVSEPNDPPAVLEASNRPVNDKYHWDHLQKHENLRFNYEELRKITNDFTWLIGKGGFGHVYYGRFKDHTEVAVKKLSGGSTHQFDQFLAEVQNLTKVHHKNLVSLVGYCSEGDHLALVYEYMSGGNLSDRLRGSGVDENLNWATRVQILIDAAQGLDYLHKGCNKPIIHRDVKTANILLGQNRRAKISDFGLSKTYLRESQSHVTALPRAGTPGYVDPEYISTGKVTKSSDVYGFGVVLLEVTMGKHVVLEGPGNITEHLQQCVASGDIHPIVDERLRGDYDVNSIRKVVEMALWCTEPLSAQRPSMEDVVALLKQSLELEKTRQDEGVGHR